MFLMKPLRLRNWIILLAFIIKVCICHHTLLFATSKDIRIATISKQKRITTIVKDLNEAVAVDYLYNKELICWTDHGLETVQCAHFNGTHTGSKVIIAKTGISAPDGLACDWLTKKLYWTDSETNRIEVVSLETKFRKVLFWQDLDQPRGIAVDPLDGVMFWTDWGEIPKIERAAMNGDLSSRKVIISENIFWPNSINLDINTKQLYWLDGKFHFIEQTDYDGRNRKKLAEKGVLYPFSLALFGDKLYWSDWKTLSIHMIDRKTGVTPKEVIHGEYVPMDIEVYDPLRQPYKQTGCELNNGKCSHLCLLSSYPPGYSCACPTGIKLISNETCASEMEEFLLLVQRSEISKISLDSPDHTNIGLPLKGIKHAVGIDYDRTNGYFYWTDDESRVIRKAKLDGTDQQDVITTDITTPDGIAIDWVARNLYWSDTAAHRIEVARLDGKYRKVLIFDDLGEPRAVAVTPEHGWLFWSDWNEKKPKIERADLDGDNRMVIVKDDINWPNGIALDYKRGKLYWGDAKVDKIEVVNMDGTERKEILSDNLPHIFGLTLLGDYLYWTDWQRRTVDRVNKFTGRDRQTILDQLLNVMGLKSVGINEEQFSNPCTTSNGGCEQLCLSRPNNRSICHCEIGYELNPDGKRCVIPDAFLIFFSEDHVNRISIQNSFSRNIIPLSGIKSIGAIDVDVGDQHLYWSDNKLKSISRAYLNGSQIEKIIEFGIYSIESIAIDWLSRNIYWIDTGNGRIEVSGLNGQYRKALFYKNLKEPKNLILDPREGLMYWTEFWKVGTIFKASMDGSWKENIVNNIGRVTGLAIDYGQRHLYWSQDDDGYSTIEMTDFDGQDRKQIFYEKKFKPSSIAVHQEFIYTVNWNDRSVIQTNKFSGKNSKTLFTSYNDHISDLKIVHSSKQTGWNACVDGGGCSHLCLVRPGISFHSTIQNCTCPAHFRIKDNNCLEPDNFVLVAQRNAFNRLLMDTDDCPDYPLPTPGLKSVRAIEFDPVTKFIYWIDGKAQAIKRTYENGTSMSIFLEGNGGRYSHFYDLALDPFNRLIFWSCSVTDTINVTRLNNSSLGVVYKAQEGEKPRNLALHPEKGLLFWTDLGAYPRIMRSRLDGQKRMAVVTDVKNIEAFTIDRTDNLIFFASMGKIFNCGLDGKNKKYLIGDGGGIGGHTVSLTVVDSFIYWADKESQGIYRINKMAGGGGVDKQIIVQQMPHITDMVAIINPTAEEYVHHPCSQINSHSSCSHLCIVTPGSARGENDSSYECSCPNGLILSDDTKTCSILPVCGKDHFICQSVGSECIPDRWKCDGQTDCPDSSDELGCADCKPNQFRCSSGNCIDVSGVCDGTHHCSDGSDEARCCTEQIIRSGAPYFQCVKTGNCIASAAVCDGWDHCPDGSDETPGACEMKSSSKASSYSEEGSGKILFTIALICGFVCLVILVVTIFKCKKGDKPKRTATYEDAVLRPLAPGKSQHNLTTAASGGVGGPNELLTAGISSSGSCYEMGGIKSANPSIEFSTSVCLKNPVPSPTKWCESCYSASSDLSYSAPPMPYPISSDSSYSAPPMRYPISYPPTPYPTPYNTDVDSNYRSDN